MKRKLECICDVELTFFIKWSLSLSKVLENSFKNDINLIFLPLKNDNKNNIEPLKIDNNMIQFKQEIRHVTKRNLE